MDAAYSPDTFPFPVMECLDLHHSAFSAVNKTEFTPVQVSLQMCAELRRCYEYEVGEEWSGEEVTLGEAEIHECADEPRHLSPMS